MFFVRALCAQIWSETDQVLEWRFVIFDPQCKEDFFNIVCTQLCRVHKLLGNWGLRSLSPFLLHTMGPKCPELLRTTNWGWPSSVWISCNIIDLFLSVTQTQKPGNFTSKKLEVLQHGSSKMCAMDCWCRARHSFGCAFHTSCGGSGWRRALGGRNVLVDIQRPLLPVLLEWGNRAQPTAIWHPTWKTPWILQFHTICWPRVCVKRQRSNETLELKNWCRGRIECSRTSAPQVTVHSCKTSGVVLSGLVLSAHGGSSMGKKRKTKAVNELRIWTKWWINQDGSGHKYKRRCEGRRARFNVQDRQ